MQKNLGQKSVGSRENVGSKKFTIQINLKGKKFEKELGHNLFYVNKIFWFETILESVGSNENNGSKTN